MPLFSGKCLHLSGLTPEPLTADDDYKLLRLGIGFTNMVARATKGSADLTRKEIKEGQYTGFNTSETSDEIINLGRK